MSFDFQNAQLPTLEPLKNSFTYDDIERELRDLVCELYDTYIASDHFDINVLGAAHLGSLDLVRRMVNFDGLVLLPGEREEPAARYIYRAWKSRNLQGRGLYFIKTYLQMLLPSLSSVEQQMQSKALNYPTDLYPRSVNGGDSDKYLTSRIHIHIDVTRGIQDTSSLIPVLSSVLPARITPIVFLVLHSYSEFQIASVGNPAITLVGTGTVTGPDVEYGDANYAIAARGNVAITLHAISVISR